MTDPNILDVVTKLLISQQDFMNNILAQQKQFVDNGKQPTTSSSNNNHIPPFQPFDKEKCSWEIYLQQLEQHFDAYNVITSEKKRAYLLSWLGPETYELLQKLFGSIKLASREYDDITKKLSEHFLSKIHVCTARHDFFKCRMQANQSYSDWIAELRGLSRQCQFVCSADSCSKEFVDDMIRDVIVLHTPHDSVRTATLQKPNASLSDVMLIAEAYEATQKSLQTMRYEPVNVEVNQLSAKRRGKKHNGINTSKTKMQSCSGCNVHHQRENCKFLSATCRKCGKIGHIAPVCLGANKKKTYRHHSNNKGEHVYHIEHILSVKHLREENNKLLIDMMINNVKMEFLLDTGASATVIGLPGFKQLNCPEYHTPSCSLKAFGANTIPILGETTVTVNFNGESYILPILIANTPDADNICGLNWAKKFGFEASFSTSNHKTRMLKPASACNEPPPATPPPSEIDRLLSTYPDLFADNLGCCTSYKVHLYLKPTARPKFFKARPLPFSQLEAFEAEAKRLEAAGIWKPVRFSQWAAPIVVVTKRNNKLRICGDFKVTLNHQLEVDQYPIPRPEELFHKLANGRYFSKIDMSDAYLQLELDEQSKPLAVVNTPIGLFQYQRLPFGIASAPAIYQRTLEMILNGIDCAIYLDDILVAGNTYQEHIRKLEAVLQRLLDHGLRVNRSKCQFFQHEAEYLGHVVNHQGVRPSDSGLAAIEKLPRPGKLKELETFMGKVNYYNKYVNNFSQIAAPLNALRRKGVPFTWKADQEHAFNALKQQIINAARLAHFRPELPLVLAADASSHGIGAILSHIMTDGSEQPIAFASKTLNEHQLNYSQIEKEALAIIYGVTKFHQYLFGRKFILLTDHKPLLTIFNPDKALPTATLSRLQRWAITLMSYSYEIRYRPTKKHTNVDALSRLPIGPDASFDKHEVSCFEISSYQNDRIDDFPIKTKDVTAATKLDAVLRKTMAYVTKGWPTRLSSDEHSLQPYFNRKASLTQYRGIILLEAEHTRVVLPKSLQKRTLQLLHQGHWGVVRMKQLARRHCWWPQIDADIESKVKACKICQRNSPAPPQEFSSWPDPDKPWQRVHVDFAGPFLGKMWLVCIDALSKFPFVLQMQQTTTAATVRALQTIFTLEGIPEAIVSDNGPQFTSTEFINFCSQNGIQSLKTAPFHPASNGEAERFVRTFKANLKKIIEEEKHIDIALLRCLESYRTTPNPQTGKSPAEILHGRQHRTILSQMVPDRHSPDKLSSSGTAKFQINEAVYARNYSRGHRWISGTVISHMGKRMYRVRTKLGIWKRHQNQMKPRCTVPDEYILARDLATAASSQGPEADNQQDEVQIAQPITTPIPPSEQQENTPRRSQRTRKQVVRFGYGSKGSQNK